MIVDPSEQTKRRFAEEREAYRLVFTCEACVHLDAESGHCSMGYPNAGLRNAAEAMDSDGRVLFCKYFELT